MKYKSFNLDYQSYKSQTSTLNNKICIEGYASIFEIEDRDGEIIRKGAFINSIENQISAKLLWQHNINYPIGVVSHLEEDDCGLFVKSDLSTSTTHAKEASMLVKEGIIDSFSVGFIPIKTYFDAKGKLNITEATLYEISLVTFPANTMSKITKVHDKQ